MVSSIFDAILILLVVAVIAVTIFQRFRLPAVLAYLCVGAAVGPHGMGWIPDSEDTRLLAEFGVVFLLFTVGLEFSLQQLVTMKLEVLGLGGAQVIVTALIVAIIAWALGMSPEAAFVIGGVLALSSTAIVIKQLKEQLELSSRHGRLAIGVLLFQDVAVIPFLILIPALAGHSENSVMAELALALLKGSLVVLVMLAIGRWLLRPLFHEIALLRSSELFTMTALLFTLAAAWTTHSVGLSLAFGAFLAGMMLGETEFRHQVEADIRPFRDVLLGLFFITIGMLLDIQRLLENLHWVLLVMLAMMLGKTVLIMLMTRLMGMTMGVAMRTGIVLSQGGEFGFALLALAVAGGLLASEPMQIVLAAVILSMVLAPLLIHFNGAIAKKLCGVSYLQNREQIAEDLVASAQALSQHTIVCGYGRVGQNVVRFLEQFNFDYIALDLDPVRVREARSAGEQVNYGDASHRKILEAAGLMRARAVVITFEDFHADMKIIAQVRARRPDIPILVRTADDANLERLQQLGATEVVPEALEASLMLSSHLLLLLGVSLSKVLHQVQNVRNDRYQMLRSYFHGQEAELHEESDAYRERLQTITLPYNAYAIGKTIHDLHLDEFEVGISAIRRRGIRCDGPVPEMVLQVDDALVLYGLREGLNHAEQRLLSGYGSHAKHSE